MRQRMKVWEVMGEVCETTEEGTEGDGGYVRRWGRYVRQRRKVWEVMGEVCETTDEGMGGYVGGPVLRKEISRRGRCSGFWAGVWVSAHTLAQLTPG